MIKGFTTVATAGAVFLAAGGTSLAAAKPKPVGYGYGQCTTKTACTYQASVTPQQNKVAISSQGLCVTGEEGLSQAGFAKVKRNGKFSLSKTITVETSGYQKVSVQVNFSGSLKVGKKLTGSLQITTSSPDCTADTGVKKSFSMKYKGPFYGG
jgi:hypothetical protein